jgi:hypothetical protein
MRERELDEWGEPVGEGEPLGRLSSRQSSASLGTGGGSARLSSANLLRGGGSVKRLPSLSYSNAGSNSSSSYLGGRGAPFTGSSSRSGRNLSRGASSKSFRGQQPPSGSSSYLTSSSSSQRTLQRAASSGRLPVGAFSSRRNVWEEQEAGQGEDLPPAVLSFISKA